MGLDRDFTDGIESARPRRRRVFGRRGLGWLATVLALYVAISYVGLPWIWWLYERVRSHLYPALPGAPRVALTVDHIPGDPLNIAIVGTQDQVTRAMEAAGWYTVDPLNLRSRLRIVEDVLRDRPYLDAPVSSLYVWGRPQDLAFEQPVGDSPRHRHHVRFWRSSEPDDRGRPLWLGAATFDRSVGLSHETGQVTHHVAPDVDAERDKIVADLQRAHRVASIDREQGIWPRTRGYNGGGDPYHTDGMMAVVVLSAASQPVQATDVPGGD